MNPTHQACRRVQRETRKWYIEYRDANRKRRRVVGFRDKKATEQRAAELEQAAERQESGLIDSSAEHRKRPLTEHVTDWHASLLARGNTAKHADMSAARARRILAECEFQVWSDVSASHVEVTLAELRANGLSISSSNHHLQAIKAFCRWMTQDGRAIANPLAHIRRGNARTDCRRERRSLTDVEFNTLLRHTEHAPTRFKMTGSERAMLYRLGVETGLRAGELRSLTPGSFLLDETPPSITVAAAYSKRRQKEKQPLTRGLARTLREWLALRPRSEPLFTMPDSPAKMLRADLADTREAWICDAPTERERDQRERSRFLSYRDDAGRVADFHALRHTFITNLVRGGVHPKVAQQLARHSTITLTMHRYSHTEIEEAADALSALPGLAAEESVGVANDSREKTVRGSCA